MPGKVKVKIVAGRNLPVMDRSSDTTDAYVEIKLGNTTYKTDVCRKSLNPHWNSEWYRFEVDDSELQDEPLQIRLMDHDTYSANDAIGKVYMNLNPLLIPSVALPGKYGWGGDTNVDQPSSSVMSGWIPVYDTMHGIRGEVNVTVKVELFSDFNKFRQSSCGVQFFCSPVIPHGFHAQVIHGFIEELVVNDDPEYQWIDKIRTPRASNEARQTLFFKLSGELQRKIGVKALDLGGNAVIGYNQCFDLEGEFGIVARGIGTVVILVKHHEMQQQLDIGIAEEKALSYFKFLAFDNGLKLENDNIFERFTQSSPISKTSIFVSTDSKEQFPRLSPRRNIPTFIRQSSQPLIKYEPLPSNLKTSISSRSLSEDIKQEIALRQLLQHEEMRGGCNSGLSCKMKYLKQNMLYKKMNAIKTKLSDSSMQESLDLDSTSISSREESSGIRSSLIDLRELRKKKKQSSSSYMAELLVRSVMQVHTSLDCIVECHDSGPVHSSSTSKLNEDIGEGSSHQSNECLNADLEVSSTSKLNKTISEPYLLLPDSTMVTPSSNASSDSELSSSDGSDSPSEIKDDKLDFDTVSFIVKNVQNEEHDHNNTNQDDFFYFDMQDINEINKTGNDIRVPATAPALQRDNNLFSFSMEEENKIGQLKTSTAFIDRLQPRKKGDLKRALSSSCTDITIVNNVKTENNSSSLLCPNTNIEYTNVVMLPSDIEKRIDKLRHSALFRSISERPKSNLNKTFSISHEDISTTNAENIINENLLLPSTFQLGDPKDKRRLTKTLSISCEEIYSPNLAELEKRIKNLRHSALFRSISKKSVPQRRGKLQRTFSISYEDNVNEENNETYNVVLPADIEKNSGTSFYSSLSNDNSKIKPRTKGKMKRALSRSCTDISLSDKIELDKKLLSANAEKKIDMFKNSPLFKISIMTETKTKGKMNRELSRSHTDFTLTNKHKKENLKNHSNLTDFASVKTAVHTILTEKINLLTPESAPISPRAQEELRYSSYPDLGYDNLIKTAMQTILKDKIDLMTSQQTPVSKRVKEQFQKSFGNSLSQSNPDLITFTENKICFPKNSPFLRKDGVRRTGNLTFRSDPELSNQNSVKCLFMNKIHLPTSKSPSLLRKFNGDIHRKYKSESHSLFHHTNGDKEFVYSTEENIPSASQKQSNSNSVSSEHYNTDPFTHSYKEQNPSSANHEHANLDKVKSAVHHGLDNISPTSLKNGKKFYFSKNEETYSSLMKVATDRENSKTSSNKHEQHEVDHKKHEAMHDKHEFKHEKNEDKHEKHEDKHRKHEVKHENFNDKVKIAMHNVMDKVHHLSSPTKEKTIDFNDKEENQSLMKTAMQTMLLDKVNIIAPNSPQISPDSGEFQYEQNHQSVPYENMHLKHELKHENNEDNHEKHEDKHEKHEIKHENFNDKVKIAMHNVMDKVHHLSSPTKEKTNDFDDKEENQSLMKTAMQTMLLDKINIIAPNSPQISPDSGEFQYEQNHQSVPYESMHEKHELKHENNEDKHEKHEDKHGKHEFKHENFNDKVKIAMHNVMDKVHHLSSPTKEKTNDFDDEEKNQSLMKTAMQTMLLDKINIIAPNSPQISPDSGEFQYEQNHQSVPYESMHEKHELKHENNEDKYEKHEDKHGKHEVKHENFNDKVKIAMHNVMDKVHHLSSPTKEKTNDFDDEEKNQSLMKTAMQTMLLDKINIIALNSPQISPDSGEFQYEQNHQSVPYETVVSQENIHSQNLVKTAVTMKSETILHSEKELPVSSDAQSSSKSDSGKRHSIFSTIKRKCKSLKPKMTFSKLIHRDSNKNKAKDEGLVESAMTTSLLDRVNNIQETMNSSEEHPILSSVPAVSPPKADKQINLDDITLILPCTEEPIILIRPDTGNSYNKMTAVTADDANCNTNAEHAPCLYTSDRRIVESPVPAERDDERERERARDRENVREPRERHGHQRTESTGGKSPARLNAIPYIHRRSSDSDLSITPKGNSLTGSDRSGGTIPGYHHIRSTLLRPTVDNFDMMEYPFLTMAKYPPGFILHLGGAVSARSVKLLERITNIEEPETRDTWWSEIRMEIRTHARALNCNAVLGYAESTSICDEVCVLSASGTAAVIALYSGELSDGISGLPNLHKPYIPNKDLMTSSLDRTDFERDKNSKVESSSTSTNNKSAQVTESPEQEASVEFSGSTSAQTQPTSCRICHIPYSESTMSFRINMLYCSMCKLAKVPDILLTTIEMPEGLPITGRGCFLQSYVCRPKRDLKGELNAKEISESLPFLEYELHRLLVNKMKVKAMNTIFGLKVRITIGERMLIGVATGTAVFLMPLPPPPLPKLIAGNATTQDKRLVEMQKLLVDTVKKNKEIYELKDTDNIQPAKLLSDTEESDDEKSNVDLVAGNKDTCVLEVDDSEDIEVINLLVEPRPPDGFHVVNTENVPGLEELEIVRNLQMFTQVWRAKIPLNQSASHFGKHFQKLLQSVYFKLRRMIPCALCDLQFRVDLPEPDEIQLTLLGMALGLGDPMKLNKFKRKFFCHLPSKELLKKPGTDDELIFSLEEDQIPENSIPFISQGAFLNTQMPKHRQKSPQRLRTNPKQRHTPIKERHGVDITPLSYVPGGKIERYLGYLNFFFIRETTSIREGGGLSGFVHSFITEVLAIVRAHITALGGNAMVSYFMTECVLYHNAHKNQGQCLINVGGDVVFVSYFTEDN